MGQLFACRPGWLRVPFALLIGLGAAAVAACDAAQAAPARQPAEAAAPVNAAGIDVHVVPEAVSVGATFTFHVTSRQAGFLVVLDVNAEGSVTQLYPNVFSMKLASDPTPTDGNPCDAPAANTLSSFGLQAGDNVKANRIEAGQALDLPGDPQGAGYALQACPPRGTGMVIAVLSDKPVQIIDLPDIPAGTVGQQAGADRLVAALQALRLVSSDDATGRPDVGPRWSVDWVAYTIR